MAASHPTNLQPHPTTCGGGPCPPLSATSLKQFEKCAKRLYFYHLDKENGSGRFTDIFLVGSAAHSMLETLSLITNKLQETCPGEELSRAKAIEVLDQVVVKESDLPAKALIEARRIALSWYDLWVGELGNSLAGLQEVLFSLTPEWQMRGVASTKDPNWKLPGYHGIMDLVQTGTDEDFENGYDTNWVRVYNYKTAWPTSDAEHESVQIKIELLATLAAYTDYETLGDGDGDEDTVFDTDKVEVIVVNLRTRQSYPKVYWLNDPEDRAKIEAMRKEVELVSESAQHAWVKGELVATPGLACMTCPWLHRCEKAQKVFADMGVSGAIDADAGMTEIAKFYAVATAMRKEAMQMLKLAATDQPIPLGDSMGSVAGFAVKETKEIGLAGMTRLWREWVDRMSVGRTGFGVGFDLEAVKEMIDQIPSMEVRGELRAAFAALFARVNDNEAMLFEFFGAMKNLGTTAANNVIMYLTKGDMKAAQGKEERNAVKEARAALLEEISTVKYGSQFKLMAGDVDEESVGDEGDGQPNDEGE